MEFIIGMDVVIVVRVVGERLKGGNLLKNKLKGWIFNQLYWCDMDRVPKKNWKEEVFKQYVLTGLSKKYKKGTFEKAWRFIKKAGLIREGRISIRKRIKMKKEKE